MEFTERYIYDADKDSVGTGGFSKIYKAYDTLREETVALKFFSGEVKEKYGIIAEAKRLLKLNHPNVIRFYDLETMNFTNIHMKPEKVLIGVLEYIDGGDLKAAANGQLSEEQKLEITMGLLDGLKYIHSKNLIHRDLKPGNVVLKYDGNAIVPKLIDFGISKKSDDDTSSSSQLLGTVEYMAPEQFNPKKYGKIGPETDIWSFSVLIYEMYTGKRLFGSRGGGQQTEEVISKILLEDIKPDFTGVPENIKEVLKKGLIRNVADRPKGIGELIGILNKTPILIVKDNATVETEEKAADQLVADKPNLDSSTQILSKKDIGSKRENDTAEKAILPMEKVALEMSNEGETEVNIKESSGIAGSADEKRNAIEKNKVSEVEQDLPKSKKKWLLPLSIMTVVILLVTLYAGYSDPTTSVEYVQLKTEANLLAKHKNWRESLRKYEKAFAIVETDEVRDSIENINERILKIDKLTKQAIIDEKEAKIIEQNRIDEEARLARVEMDEFKAKLEEEARLAGIKLDEFKAKMEKEARRKELALEKENARIRADKIADEEKNKVVVKSLKDYKVDDGSTFDYYGETVNSLPEGKGKSTYEKGSTYEGEWSEGEKSGQGTFIWGGDSKGDKYVGSYSHDKRNGQGTYIYRSGNKYVGQWSRNVREGLGTFTWSSGAKHVGHFKKGKRHGQGTHTYADGSTYVGEWANGKKVE